MQSLIHNASEYVEELRRCIGDVSEKRRVQYAGLYSDILPLLSMSELSEYMMRYWSSSSISVMNLMWLLVHSSFEDWPGVLVGRNIWMFSGMLISVILHGGLGCGFVCSVCSRILLLILVMHVVNFIFGFLQCLLELL